MGLVFLGPILATSALPLLARPSFVLKENAGKVNDTFELSNDMIHSACPHIINTIDFIRIEILLNDHYQYH